MSDSLKGLSTEEMRQARASLGGNALLKKYGKAHFREMGRRGGTENFRRHGHEHYVKIAAKGGSAKKHRAE